MIVDATRGESRNLDPFEADPEQPIASPREHPPTLDPQACSQINQAIGVLIERGHLPDEAESELRRLSADDSDGLHDGALQIIASLSLSESNTDTQSPPT